MDLFKRIIVNISAGWTARVINIVITFISLPIILSFLGMHDYGLWVTIGQGVGFFGLLDFGIANSVCRFISRSDALEDSSEKNGIYSTAFLFFCSVSVTIILVTLVLYSHIPDIFRLDSSHETVAEVLFVVMGANLGLLFPLRVGRGLLQATNDYHLIDFVVIFFRCLHFAAILVCYALNMLNLYSICLVSAFCNALVEIILFYQAKKRNADLMVRFKHINRQRIVRLFSFGSSSLVQTFAAMLYTKGQTIAISLILGVESVPLFSIPVSLLSKIGPFIGKTGSIFMPIASSLDAQGKSDKIVRLSVYGLRYSLMIGFFVGVYIVFFGNDLLVLWLKNSTMKPGELKMMHTALMIMVFPLVISRANKGNQTILRATGNHWKVSNSLIVFTLVGLLISVGLMRYTAMGVLGAAIGWSIKGLIPEFLLFTIFMLQKYRIPPGSYLLDAYGFPFIGATLIALVTTYCKPLFIKGDITHLLLESFLYFTFSFLIFCLIIDKDHWRRIMRLLKRDR